MPIEHRWLTKAIENAQKKVEGHNFDIRKNLLEYDDVMNQQRKTIYAMRRQVLAAGADEPLVEYDREGRAHDARRSASSARSVDWADQREKVVSTHRGRRSSTTSSRATCPPGKSPEAWDLERLKRAGARSSSASRCTSAGSAGDTRGAAERDLQHGREGLQGKGGAVRPGQLPQARAVHLPATSSTRSGRTTCWRWITCARASACAATRRRIPRWSTRRRASSCSSMMTGRIRGARRRNSVAGAAGAEQGAGGGSASSAQEAKAGRPSRPTGRARRTRRAAKPQTVTRAGAQGRPQRPVPVRERQEVQEVPRRHRTRRVGVARLTIAEQDFLGAHPSFMTQRSKLSWRPEAGTGLAPCWLHGTGIA